MTNGSTTADTSAGGAATTIGTTTTVSTTTGSSTTDPNCAGLICAGGECPDGRWETPPGRCCPVCTCEGVVCEEPVCPSGQTLTPPDHCCPQCVDLLCSGVVCQGPSDCGDGRTYSRPDGACCAGCMPLEPALCPELGCPDDTCPKGYVSGDAVGGCCTECLPDPLYCEVSDDCVAADRPRECCGCPEIISKRALDDDACWSPSSDPRPIPDACYPDVTCDAVCGACPPTGVPVCVDNRCVGHVLE